MSAKRILTIGVAALMLSSLALGGALASSTATTESSDEVHSGTHLSFETTADAITNYSVNDAGLLSSVQVESSSDAEQRGAIGVDAGLSANTYVQAAGVDVNSESDTQVKMSSETGAKMEAHDSQRGHLLIHAEDDGQLVTANLSTDADAEQESDSRVVVTHDDGTEGTFIVIGDGEVTVNDEGNVTAQLEQGAKLTYQQYAEERSAEDDEREQLIADGTAAAEVYVTTAAESGSETTADVVQYSEDTTVEVLTHSENTVEMSAERAESEGRIIITSVSEEAFESAEDIEVAVDGEAAVRAESTSELAAAADGGEDSAYLVRSASTAEASSEVLIGVNHFSERTLTLSDGSEGDDGTTDDAADDELPGFGIILAGIALLSSGIMAARRAR